MGLQVKETQELASSHLQTLNTQTLWGPSLVTVFEISRKPQSFFEMQMSDCHLQNTLSQDWGFQWGLWLVGPKKVKCQIPRLNTR